MKKRDLKKKNSLIENGWIHLEGDTAKTLLLVSTPQPKAFQKAWYPMSNHTLLQGNYFEFGEEHETNQGSSTRKMGEVDCLENVFIKRCTKHLMCVLISAWFFFWTSYCISTAMTYDSSMWQMVGQAFNQIHHSWFNMDMMIFITDLQKRVKILILKIIISAKYTRIYTLTRIKKFVYIWKKNIIYFKKS